MNIQEFNAQYITSNPSERKKMSTDCLQSEFVTLVDNSLIADIDIDALKFIARKSFNNIKNKQIIQQKWSMEFIFGLIMSAQEQNNKDASIYLLDILSNLTGITTDQCEFNYQTPSGTNLQVLPFKQASSLMNPWTKGYSEKHNEALIRFLSDKSTLTRRYAARCILNFSNSRTIQLTEEKIRNLLTTTTTKDKLTRLYIYAALRNYVENKIIPNRPELDPALDLAKEFQSFQSELTSNFKQHKTISRTDIETILSTYQTKSLWRWFWSQLGLMNKDSGTIFCLRQLLLQNNDASLSLDAIGTAINHPDNYDSKKNHRFRMFQQVTVPRYSSTDFETDNVLNEIRRRMQ